MDPPRPGLAPIGGGLIVKWWVRNRYGFRFEPSRFRIFEYACPPAAGYTTFHVSQCKAPIIQLAGVGSASFHQERVW